jgi:hypothetical protein
MAMRYGVVLVVVAVMLERRFVYHEEMQETNEAQAHSPSAFVAHHLLKPQSTHIEFSPAISSQVNGDYQLSGSTDVELLINKRIIPLRPLKAPGTASRASRGALHGFSDQTLTCAGLFVCLSATLNGRRIRSRCSA